MNREFDEGKPIFQQVRERIEDQILNDQLKEGDQIPSTNQLVNFYKINHLTVSKGINQLTDEGVIFKKRGVGMFVSEGAKEKLIEKRKHAFLDTYIVQLVREANKLKISDDEMISMIREVKKGSEE
ncbi:GntR family transcriptional regulator [Piscibacillus salipiscarius]|uniref:GntR family transcriptional regulator n=1 Tax=Piscibacillus salipiscarius TaxID=299480 RepID=A0ABW5Q6Z4_9BACI|nr:GntR family transcriptional regulator [Piscibacillus salipiscarius]